MKALVASVALVAGLSCASAAKFAPLLADLLVMVQDAQEILASLEHTSRAHFAAHPSVYNQLKCEEAFARAHKALDEGLRYSSVAGQAKGFSEFEHAYSELLATLHSAGVIPEEATLGLAPEVPRPMVLE